MFFDVKAARIRIEARGAPPADLPKSPVISGLAGLAGGKAEIEKTKAPAQTPKPAPQPTPQPSAEIFPHGQSVTGQPKTWTGRIVTFADWPTLSEWEKHGPNGRLWNGKTQRWDAQ